VLLNEQNEKQGLNPSQPCHLRSAQIRREGDFPCSSRLASAIRVNWRECMVRTAKGLKLGERIVRVNVSGLFVENRSPGTR
jgi:hypothetical protein